FFQAEDGIRDGHVTGVQTCALPISTRVEVSLQRNASGVSLSVSDNGRGFTAEEGRKRSSYGLLGLRERVYLVGGEVDIDSRPGRSEERRVGKECRCRWARAC